MANRRRNVADNSDLSSEEMSDNADNNSRRQATNMFANDGSFLEMFKKKMEQMQTTAVADSPKCVSDAPIPSNSSPCSDTIKEDVHVKNDVENNDTPNLPQNQPQQKKTSLQSFVGKRRGGKVLPTGMVKKVRKDGEEKGADKEKQRNENRTDAWSQYMAEVRKYKERSCEDEGKTRPLVK